ncbi:MAG TPA: redoxin family protein [Tepidisphaeraceae bacterium]|nr:redoxin family protein [Tepidisphaeraceae bacterium]
MRKILMPLAGVAMLALAFSMAVAADEKKAGGAGVKPGEQAPSFSLQDQDGKSVNLADLAGKVVVLEWFNNECPFVVRHHEEKKTMAETSAKWKDKDVVWLAVNTTNGKTNADNKAVAGKWSIAYPILNDSTGEVGKAYGAKTTPHMFVIDKTGKIAYAGGIDDDPKGDKADRVNLVDKALTELTSGSSVTQPMSKPYGCSVKYAK